ncbi:MAG: hypothetical protein Q9M26_08650 [Mariprofundales bacterium]|nr:hypothetical protein [Mariprofundales bacterium]
MKNRWGFIALLLALITASPALAATPQQQYKQAMVLAAQGQDAKAMAILHDGFANGGEHGVWQERMAVAATLIGARQARSGTITLPHRFLESDLLDAYIQHHPMPSAAKVWLVGMMAGLLPGSGHGWLGRWHDAAVSALLVWPMLLLTWWAWRRRMGPVTLFFALLTIWLWSGTLFSAVSLAERGNMASYMAWWQGVWQASGLRGRPW